MSVIGCESSINLELDVASKFKGHMLQNFSPFLGAINAELGVSYAL